MDPTKFDGMIRQLSQIWSRRVLVEGSLGAAFLAVIGVGEDALGQQVDAEHNRKTHCYPTGRRCGYTKKKKNGKKDPRPCSRCCHHFSATRDDGKQECACIPTADLGVNATPCKNDTQCCSGVCGNGICQFATCAELGQACNENVPEGTFCCSVAGSAFSICNQTGTAAGTCVQCLANGATCDILNDLCCGICNAGTCEAL